MSPDYEPEAYDGPPRNIAYIDQLDFDPSLQPKHYEIAGTAPNSRVLILDVEILEATGREPHRGDVLIVGELLRLFDLVLFDLTFSRPTVHSCRSCTQ